MAQLHGNSEQCHMPKVTFGHKIFLLLCFISATPNFSQSLVNSSRSVFIFCYNVKKNGWATAAPKMNKTVFLRTIFPLFIGIWMELKSNQRTCLTVIVFRVQFSVWIQILRRTAFKPPLMLSVFILKEHRILPRATEKLDRDSKTRLNVEMQL